MYDVAIRAGYLLTMAEGEDTVLKDQLVGIKNNKIAFIGPWVDADADKIKLSKKYIDARHKILMPGLINAHTHLAMSLFRGLADDLPFEEWLNNYIFPLEARVVNEEFVKLGAELGALEALLSGCTTVCDMYFFEKDIADVINKVGMRAMLGETTLDFPAPDNKKQNANDYKILNEFREKYKNHELIRPVLAPHAPYTCSDKTLEQVVAYAKEHKTFVTIHVSETKKEVEDSLKKYGMSPVARLHKLGFFEIPALFAHCIHLSEADIDLLSKSKLVSVVHNPESNMKLGAGPAPIRELIRRGATVALGTDGAASNNNLDLFREMDTASKLQKLVNSDNTAMTARTALKMATLWGARALGLGKTTGSLEVGKSADCIIVRTDKAHMQPIHSIESNLVYSASGSDVETVIVNGKILVEDGKSLTIDSEELFSKIKTYRTKMNF